jgi:Amt family ammonium transporter
MKYFKYQISNFKLLIITVVISLFASPAFAGETPALDSGDTAWILVATALVLFMTLPGLALFYGGLVRTKNVLSVLLQCFAISGVVTILWLMGGYSIAFSEGNAFTGGLSKMFFAGMMEGSLSGTIPESLFALFQMTFAIITPEGSLSGTIPESLFALFQMTFAIITPALIIGGFAERMKLSSRSSMQAQP